MRLIKLLELLWISHRKAIVSLAGLLVLNLLLYFVVVEMLGSRVVEQESHFLQRQSEVRQLLHNQGSSAESPEEFYALGSQDLLRFEQAVPDYSEFTGLIEELLVLSSRARLDITQIVYSTEELKNSSLLKLSLTFNLTGDYEKLKRFIHSLEQSVRLITIKQISLQGADDNGVNLRLSLETIFRLGSHE